MTDVSPSSPALPVPAPDLLLEQQAPRAWQVVAALPGAPFGLAPGRLLPAAAGTPSLLDLVEEVAARQESLRGIPWREEMLTAGSELRVELLPWGFGGGALRPRVAIYLQPLPAVAAAPAPADRVSGLVGRSPALREVCRKIALYAPSDAPVVVTGETGTGKELVAAALHRLGPRRRGELVAVNCAAISEQLLESELFGHERGAFTGAVRTHRGRFERADGGTLFLDEVGELPPHTQAKLLRALELGSIERVGGESEIPVDVRLVSATNRPLEQEVAHGRFRADLYHRLAVLRIHLPPLRERREDIPALVDHFLAQFHSRYQRPARRLTGEALALLQSYLWPGNVRELRNVLERVFVETEAEVIGARAFADWVRERQGFQPPGWSLESRSRPAPPLVPPYPLPEAQRLLGAPPGAGQPAAARPSTRPAELAAGEIRAAYHAAAGNLAAAARLLGVHRATLYRYLQRLGLTRAALGGQESSSRR